MVFCTASPFSFPFLTVWPTGRYQSVMLSLPHSSLTLLTLHRLVDYPLSISCLSEHRLTFLAGLLRHSQCQCAIPYISFSAMVDGACCADKPVATVGFHINFVDSLVENVPPHTPCWQASRESGRGEIGHFSYMHIIRNVARQDASLLTTKTGCYEIRTKWRSR